MGGNTHEMRGRVSEASLRNGTKELSPKGGQGAPDREVFWGGILAQQSSRKQQPKSMTRTVLPQDWVWDSSPRSPRGRY